MGDLFRIFMHMRKTFKSPDMTSFHGSVFTATVQKLREILGLTYCEQNDGKDKVNFEWAMETEAGDVFTVYDWKEYRKIDEDEDIEWHIGGHSEEVTKRALEEIKAAL